LYPGLRYRHWPGLKGRTHPFGLAASYVFIKQSRPPCHCDLKPQPEAKASGTPSPEVTGLICRVPSPGFSPTRLRLLTQGHLCRFWVRARRILSAALFSGSRNRLNPPIDGRPFPSSPGSRLYGSPRASTVRWSDGSTQPIPKRQAADLALPRSVPPRYRNINRFPFRRRRLRVALGPTYPRLTIVAGEPLPLRRRGFSPLSAVTTTGICTCGRSTGLHSPASAQPQRPPTAAAYEAATQGIGTRLSPVHFRRPQPRLVSCYALLRGWLLLSLPPSCLWLRTTFNFCT
jgi:hypothetical protein